jgi:hypothetical protein
MHLEPSYLRVERHPLTWRALCISPYDWGKAQTDRVLDLMDIDYLRLAQADTDSTHKTLVWNLSQNVDRTTGRGLTLNSVCGSLETLKFLR